jgi:hypothetical protein
MSRLYRLEGIETKENSAESFFKICVIRERELVFQSSLLFFSKPKGRTLLRAAPERAFFSSGEQHLGAFEGSSSSAIFVG